MKIIVTRDSVCAADDCDAPHKIDLHVSDTASVVDNLFTRQHILVVQSQFFPTFLHTFYGRSAPPLKTSDPLVPSGQEDAQPGSPADLPQAAGI